MVEQTTDNRPILVRIHVEAPKTKRVGIHFEERSNQSPLPTVWLKVYEGHSSIWRLL